MTENVRLLKNTVIIMLGNFGTKLISFLLLPLYTSILSTEEYGTYDFILAISVFLIPVATMCMHEAMFRFIIDKKSDQNEFCKIISNTLMIMIIGLALVGIIMFIVNYLVYNSINYVYIWTYTLISCLYLFANNMLRGLGKIKEYAIITSGKNIIQLIFNIISVAILKMGINGLVISLCVSEFIAFCFVFIKFNLWKYIRIKYIELNKIKNMLKYSIPLIPNALCAQIINISDRLIISCTIGTAYNGIYSISYKFPNIVETVYHYFYTAWSESASRVFTENKENANEYYQSLYSKLEKIVYSVILVMIAVMPILFRMFVRGEYIEGFKYIPILLIAMYYDCLAKFYSGIYTALKKTKILAISTIVAAICNILINVFLIRRVGLYAAAISTLVAEFILVVLRKKWLIKDIKIETNTQKTIINLFFIIIIVLLYDYYNLIKLVVSIIIAFMYAIYTNKEIINSILKKNGELRWRK